MAEKKKAEGITASFGETGLKITKKGIDVDISYEELTQLQAARKNYQNVVSYSPKKTNPDSDFETEVSLTIAIKPIEVEDITQED